MISSLTQDAFDVVKELSESDDKHVDKTAISVSFLSRNEFAEMAQNPVQQSLFLELLARHVLSV